jgi:hypothetical protein
MCHLLQFQDHPDSLVIFIELRVSLCKITGVFVQGPVAANDIHKADEDFEGHLVIQRVSKGYLK